MSLSAGVLQRLQSRAAQADQIVAQLRAQVQLLKNNAGVYACKAEEKKLQDENNKLKQEIQNLKERLIRAEIKNGVTQVPLPQAGAAPSVAAQPTSAAPQKPTKQEKQQPQNKKEQQPNKKDEKPVAKKEKKEKESKPKKPQAPPADAAPIDVSRLDMRIGFINSAKKHPDADGLYVEEVDVGEEKPRTIVSGLVNHVPLDQMQQRHAIFLCNLKPAKMRGILSEGMIMCGSTPEKVEIIDPPPGVVKGDRIVVDDYPGEPDALLNPKKKIWEQVQPHLSINTEGFATYKGKLWRVEGKGTCKVPSLKNVMIK